MMLPSTIGFAALTAFEQQAKMLPPADISLSHCFCDGMYAREMRAPAGVALVSKTHRKATISVLSEGSMLIVSQGQEPQQIDAPKRILAHPGVKRVAITLTPCTWTTFVRTDKTDPVEAEKELCFSEEEEALLLNGEQTCLL